MTLENKAAETGCQIERLDGGLVTILFPPRKEGENGAGWSAWGERMAIDSIDAWFKSAHAGLDGVFDKYYPGERERINRQMALSEKVISLYGQGVSIQESRNRIYGSETATGNE